MPRYGLFLLVALLSLSLVLAGCTAPAETPAAPPPSAGAATPEPPVGPAQPPTPAPEEAPPVAPGEKPAVPQPGPGADAGGKRLYFRLWGTTPDLMYLVPVTVEPPHPEDMPQQALALLLNWPDKSGATVSLWPAGTKAALRIKDGTATVDFTSLDTTKFGSTREAWALDSLTLTLTQFPLIKRVQVQVKGQVVETLAGHVETRRPLTPPPYVNRVAFSGTPGAGAGTMPVTLYFADPQAMFLVPITRDVPKTAAVARTVVEELIRGPEKDSGLGRVIPEGTRLRGIELKDGLLTVDFSKELRDKHWGGSAGEGLTIGAIVHSLGALPGVKQVEILIEGQRGGSIGGHVILDRPTAPGPLNVLGS